MNGVELRKLRKERGLQANFVARESGYSPQHLSKIEQKTSGLRLDEFVNIASVMGYKPGDLLENSGGVSPELKLIVDELARMTPAALTHVIALIRTADLIARDAATTATSTNAG